MGTIKDKAVSVLTQELFGNLCHFVAHLFIFLIFAANRIQKQREELDMGFKPQISREGSKASVGSQVMPLQPVRVSGLQRAPLPLLLLSRGPDNVSPPDWHLSVG